MSRNILDYKVTNTPDAYVLAKFIHELTLKGYEPLPLQCTRQYGNMVVTMAKYDEGVKDESVKESDVGKSGSEATDPVGNADVAKETEQTSESKDGTGIDESGVEDTHSDVGSSDSDAGSEVEPKPKTKRVTKPKA